MLSPLFGGEGLSEQPLTTGGSGDGRQEAPHPDRPEPRLERFRGWWSGW